MFLIVRLGITGRPIAGIDKAIVLSGKKDDPPSPDVLEGRVYTDVGVYEEVHYTLNRQGNRSAWTNKGRNVEVADILGGGALKFSQGCDLFPRTALFHEFVERPNGNWDIAPIERTSNLWYLVNDQKKTSCEGLAAENVDKSYIFDAFISKNLSPFYMATPAKVLMPGKKVDGQWKAISATDKALMNTSTAYVFNQIEEDTNTPSSLATYLHDNIKIFYEVDDAKRTFEIILYGDNPALCDTLFDSPALDYMLNNKTEAAYALLSQDDQIVVPDYIKRGIKWIKE